jgi:hypothetical protein
MSSGIRATIRFSDPGECPVVSASTAADAAVTRVSTSVARPGVAGVTEFLAPAGVPETEGIEPVFPYGDRIVYRVRHDGEERCPCECLGRFGVPVHRYEAAEGYLTVVFHVGEFDRLQEVVAELRDSYPPIDVQQLLRPPLEGSPEDSVFVNRGRLTDRQRQVLERAYEMGYFERPKRANATEVAEDLGIAQSTFTEHLMTAQRKLLGDILD